MNIITQLNNNELVRGLPKISFEKDEICEACQMGKQIKTSFQASSHGFVLTLKDY